MDWKWIEGLIAMTRQLLADGVNLSMEQLHCLLLVAARPGISVGELADEASLPQSTVSRHLKKMSSRAKFRGAGSWGKLEWEIEADFSLGLLDERVHPINGKQKALFVSEQGEALLKRLQAATEGREG